MEHQDWKPVVLNNSKTLKKGGNNVIKSNKNEDEDEKPPPKISLSNSLLIQQSRLALKLTQKQLAQKLNVECSIIQKYENGTINPDPNMLCKLRNILKIKQKFNKIPK